VSTNISNASPFATFQVVFRRKLETGDAQDTIISNLNMGYIWAMSDTKPTDSGNITQMHLYSGTVITNLLVKSDNGSNLNVTGILKNRKTIIVVHGVLMFLAWGVASFIGIFLAKYMKFKLGSSWMVAHISTYGIGVGLLSLIGLILIFLATPSPHLNGNHQVGEFLKSFF